MQTIEQKREYNRARHHSNKEKHNAISRKYYHETYKEKVKNNPAIYLFQAAKKRAKRKGIKFNIEISDIIVPEYCPVFGFKLKVFSDSKQSTTLDRINNKKGYVKGNIKVISEHANRIKSDATLDELRAVVRYMEDTCEV